MRRIDVFDMFIDGMSHSWKTHLLQGILLVLFGVFIIAFPQLLVALIASVFILAGAIFIGSALTMRRIHRTQDYLRPGFFEIF